MACFYCYHKWNTLLPFEFLSLSHDSYFLLVLLFLWPISFWSPLLFPTKIWKSSKFHLWSSFFYSSTWSWMISQDSSPEFWPIFLTIYKSDSPVCALSTINLTCSKWTSLYTYRMATTTKLLPIPSVDRMQSNKNSYTLMIQNETVTSQFGSFLWNVKHTLAILSISPTPRYLSKKDEKLYLHKNLYMNIYDRFIHNCPKLEIT